MLTIAFDARYNRGTAAQHIEAAKQFLSSAEFSRTNNQMRPAVENLFAAAELAAKAVLLAIPNPKFKQRTKHEEIHAKYNRESHIGNVPTNHSKTLNDLTKLRKAARYFNADLTIDITSLDDLAADVRSMIDFAIERYA